MLISIFFIPNSLYAQKYEYSGHCKFHGDMDYFQHCLDKEMDMYDKELNDLYRTLLKRDHNRLLKQSETSWVKFKEADCAFMAREVNEGLFFPVIEQACLINKTKSRIADLKRSFYYSGWFENQLIETHGQSK